MFMTVVRVNENLLCDPKRQEVEDEPGSELDSPVDIDYDEVVQARLVGDSCSFLRRDEGV